MTDVQEMVAGRELDTLVAERVMDRYWATIDDRLHVEHVVDGKAHYDLFEPSTDIAAAWQVVEYMRKTYSLDGNNGFLLATQGEGEPLWYCEFPNPSWMEAQADTPALAICRAALAAIGAKP